MYISQRLRATPWEVSMQLASLQKLCPSVQFHWCQSCSHQSCTQQQNSFLFAMFARGSGSLQLLLLTNCPMQLLQQAACLAHWADWQQVNHKKTKQSPLKQKLLALVSKISYLHCISLYVYCWRARSFMRKSMARQVMLTSCITEISKCLFHVYI